MSHTITTQIELRNIAALDSAVESMHGQVIGHGTHELCSTEETGYGFRLPNWYLPLVARTNGTLAYDDYRGKWGNVKDLEKLKGLYATAAARLAAEAQGYMCQDVNGELLIYHPTGGTITVSPTGEIRAEGFIGSACALATAPIAEALGQTTEEVRAIEYSQTVNGLQLVD